MTFKQKIDKILEIKQIKLWKLAEESELGTTLEKAYNENREMRESTVGKLLQKVGINGEWWNSGKGDILIKQPMTQPGSPDERGQLILQSIIDHADEYRWIPKQAFDGDYRLMLKSEIENMRAAMDKLIVAHERTLDLQEKQNARLEKENDELRERLRLTTKNADKKV
jgi:hypothetical protein